MTVRAAVLVTCLAAGATPARADGGAAEIYSVVVGWNGGNAELRPLRFADDDAARYAVFFSGLATPERPGRTVLLAELDEATRATLARAGLAVRPDGPPTREAVLGALTHLAAELRRRPAAGRRALYFAYAGHGLGGRVLLKPTHAPEAALTGAELRTALAEVADAAPGLEIFVFLDACRSQSLFAERGADRGEEFGAAIGALESRARAVRIGVITAARTGRPAGEVRTLEAGYFSHVLTSGLAGAADADGDDVVTFGELAAFAAFHTQKLTGQTPWFDPPGGDLRAGAIDHRGRRARLVIPGPDAGRYLVAAGGAGLPIFAETFKDAGRPLRLALPPGRYRVRRERAGATARADVELTAGRNVDLTPASWREADAARGEEADADVVFSSGFSPEVVSTLAAGFHAGREPAIAASARDRVTARLGIGAAPLGLDGAEGALALSYTRAFGDLLIGVVVRGATSSHRPAADRYTLRRAAVGAELGWTALQGRGWALAARGAAGVQSVLRTADTETSGDVAAPWGALGLSIDARIAGPWFATLAARWEAALVSVDGERRLDGAPATELGLGVAF